jgi:hypothetical protein
MLDTTVIIIGAMKSGTTSLFYYLSEHPEICASREKELHFFSDDRRYEQGLDWYWAMWSPKPEHHIGLEASPTYTMRPSRPQVPERIAQVPGMKFKFIYIARHPLQRFESHIRHEISRHQLQGEAVQELLASDEPILYTQYATQLDPYVQLFGREALQVMVLEDLVANPQAELAKVCTFLGIDAGYSFQNVDVVRNSKDTLNLHPWIGQIRHLPGIKTMVEWVSPRSRQELRKWLARKDPIEFQLSAAQSERIVARLGPDLEKFRQDYGVDVEAKWGIPLPSQTLG